MNLSQALKQKNRLAGEIVRLQLILSRENSRRNDSVSTVDAEKVWAEIQSVSTALGLLKGQITTANIGIYSAMERMAELKSRISFVQSLSKTEGPETLLTGRDQEKTVYTWTSTINQTRCDEIVRTLQIQINELQDTIDAYNASTQI